MEKAPENENLIETEEGLKIAEESFGPNDKLESDLVARVQEAEMMENPSEKINTLLRLSIEAKRNGFYDLYKDLKERAVQLDDENNKFFDSEAQFKAAKLKDEIARMTLLNSVDYSDSKNSYKEGVNEEREEVPQEIPKNEISVTQSIRKKIMSTLKSIF
ncbi:MAG TPA: hypothetical protein PK886_00490 [Candidatus Paceibacterota bacterium]|nr:hypothetical protein [Candidatus Paceibacterota bacterium]